MWPSQVRKGSGGDSPGAGRGHSPQRRRMRRRWAWPPEQVEWAHGPGTGGVGTAPQRGRRRRWAQLPQQKEVGMAPTAGGSGAKPPDKAGWAQTPQLAACSWAAAARQRLGRWCPRGQHHLQKRTGGLLTHPRDRTGGPPEGEEWADSLPWSSEGRRWLVDSGVLSSSLCASRQTWVSATEATF